MSQARACTPVDVADPHVSIVQPDIFRPDAVAPFKRDAPVVARAVLPAIRKACLVYGIVYVVAALRQAYGIRLQQEILRSALVLPAYAVALALGTAAAPVARAAHHEATLSVTAAATFCDTLGKS